MLTVALCPDCHRGPNGLHGLGTRGFYTRYKMDELDLLAKTLELLEPADHISRVVRSREAL